MTSSDAAASNWRDKISKLYRRSFPAVEKQAFEVLLNAELQQTEVALFKLLSKHGVSSAIEMDQWFQEGKIEEAEGWEDFFDLDALEHKKAVLKEILEEIA